MEQYITVPVPVPQPGDPFSVIAMPQEEKPCECGTSTAVLGLPIGRADPRWCASCPTKPWNAIKRCECRRKKARFAMPGSEAKDATWCADCPTKPPDAVNVADTPAFRPTTTLLPEDDPDRMCACGAEKPSLALPIQAKLARWCPQCPTKPKNAIPVKGRCQCGRRKASLGMPGTGPEGAKWCPHCPNKPEGFVIVKEVATKPVKDPSARQSRYTAPPPIAAEPGSCVCGKTTATLALPIQLWLAKWCPECPERPKNAVHISLRCECTRRKASLGVPGQPVKWCIYCPDKPDNAIPGSEKYQGGVPGDDNAHLCACGTMIASLASPADISSGAKWCPSCPDLPVDAVALVSTCECGKTKAFLGVPEDESKGIGGAKWCKECPGVPPNVINFKKRRL